MFRRPAPPPWFLVCLAVASALVLRLIVQAHGVADGPPGQVPAPSVAFLQFLIFIAGLIWKGIEVAGKVTLEALRWVVLNLSLVVTKLGNGLKALGGDLLKALKRSWDFTRKLYDDVLKPAWVKFWKWFDQFKAWLDTTFGPVLDWLKMLRDNVLAFYKNYVRPWLDLIDVTRKLLKVLAALHIPFARELDRRLAKLEEQIEKPFRQLLGVINDVINIVNRIVTLDGLIQRLTLIRSLERDYVYAWRAIVNPWHRLLTDDEKQKGEEGKDPALIAVIAKSTTAYMNDRGGADGALLREMDSQWRIYFKGQL